MEPLFYEALSTQRDDYYSPFDCKIPFLNGGLFEPIGGYNWKEINLKLDNGIFEKIFNVFDKYNFTIKEDEPLDKEVAIDPEMLGKVFENLLEIKDRKSKGAFYTPREIVHYMCQQSLINYLETNTDIPREDIEKFIYLSGFSTSEYQRKLIELEKINEQMKKFNNVLSKGYRKLLNERIKLIKNINFPKSILDNIEKVDELLRCVKIADPAVGSGAFPVGIMNEIVKARSILTPFLIAKNSAKMEDRTLYKLKWETIQNCLYGVDIDSSAVEITKLRFWLSLVVDEDSLNNIRALPNLDHKIMCGNSLLDEFEGIKLFDDSILEIPEEEDKEPEELKKLKIERENLEKTAKELMLKQKWKELEPVSKKLNELYEYIKKLENQYKKSKNKNLNDLQSQITLSDAINIRRKKSQEKLAELKKLYKEYFNARAKRDKNEYKEKIEKLEWELIEETLIESGNEDALEKLKQYKKSRSKPFFLWKLYFSDVFRRENPGFDIVIGNPPYVRQEKIKELKPALERNYKTYTGVADLYVYFYELGYNILRDEGVLAYITSNKWMRANYGEKLRKFFKENTSIKEIIDFGGEKVFETATVDTNILIFKKGYKKDNLMSAVDFTKIKNYNGFIDGIKSNRFKIPQSDLKENSFNLSPPEELNLKKKIEKIGIPLKDWDIKINYGIKTGFNDAFIIDGKTKDELIKKDPKNKEIIKPILRGRDIKRYGYEFADLWLIFVPWHFPLHNNSSISGASEEAEKAFKEQYPDIYNHLLKYKEKLSKRNKAETGKRYEWYALQRCAASYYKEFEKEKIIYPEFSSSSCFYFDNGKYYTSDTAWFIVGGSKYLMVLLNSKVIWFYLENMVSQLGSKALRMKKIYLEKLPIPKIPEDQQIPFIEKADKMIELNKKFINKKNEFLKSLNLTKITKKLETFYNLSYEEFLKELKKQKINTDSLNDLENRFNSYKKELMEIKQEIEKTDKEIDKMVCIILKKL
ncbi:Eco57I restriction-modification methylase domain-containing protein [Methanothermococcus thermolithotrophicus]|uniref:Eco57I restriction-modification methylase domain-containing protein n=1 Tax=Methanothermococcus thermolithotrophicus TaxID=2186 RepID=UPI0012F66C69|nr:Eco57I restriction-modification methylase domain-containing protein [Methanothermococcus thermolithotrophicus]